MLATRGNDGVKARRSEDGGETWGEVLQIADGFRSGGTTVDETTDGIVTFVEDRHSSAQLAVVHTMDSGKT